MRNVAVWLTLAGLALSLAASGARAGQPPKPDKPVTDDVVEKITAALPAKATVAPAKPRKILVLIATKGFRHGGAMLVGAKAVELIGTKTGAWQAITTDDVNMLAADKLREFDAVVFNNTTGKPLFDDPALQQSLMDFVKGGKGIAGIHGATDCFYETWPEFGEMMGGYFAGHPPGKITVSVKLDDPAHPLNAAFAGKGFEFNDEIYLFKAPYSRDNLRVLYSIDVENCGFKPTRGGREDNDYALGWVRSWGQGRVFYTAFGHDDVAFYHAGLLRHLLDGIQFALGDLKADTTPSARLSPVPAPVRGPVLPPPILEKPKADATPLVFPKPRLVLAAPKADGWVTLFDGKNLDAWTSKPGSTGWDIVDGVLIWKKGCGNLWTKEKFGDFVLDLEFKATAGEKDPVTGKSTATNSGVFLRSAQGETNWLHGSIEIQISNSYGPGRQPGKHDAGSVYDVYAPTVAAEKPVGEWNRMVITFKGNLLKIELNGQTIVDINLDRWTEAGMNPDGSKNKFKTAYKDMAKVGHLGLQDHGQPVWYRNVRVKPL